MSTSAGRYNASRERPWSLLFEGSVTSVKTPATDPRVDRQNHAQRVRRPACGTCPTACMRKGTRARPSRRTPRKRYSRAVAAQRRISAPCTVGRALNPQFCLEPPGDTLTRSDIYVAILCVCVPVIFDHEASGTMTGRCRRRGRGGRCTARTGMSAWTTATLPSLWTSATCEFLHDFCQSP